MDQDKSEKQSGDLYTREQCLELAREQLRDVAAGSVMFIDAVARWFVSVFEDDPKLCDRQVDLVLSILRERTQENGGYAVRVEAQQLGDVLKLAVQNIRNSRQS